MKKRQIEFMAWSDNKSVEIGKKKCISIHFIQIIWTKCPSKKGIRGALEHQNAKQAHKKALEE